MRWEQAIELRALLRPAHLIPIGRDRSAISLQTLTKLLLSLELDKSEQTSNWSRRPLTANQRKYAAVDAYILLPILDALMERIITRHSVSMKSKGFLRRWTHAVVVEASTPENSKSSSELLPSGKEQIPSRVERLGPEDVRQALLSFGMLAAAQSIGRSVEPGCTTVKTLALHTPHTLVLCMLELDRRLVMQHCAMAMGVKRAEIRMVRTENLVAVVGFPRGGVGPIGTRCPATVLVDEHLVNGIQTNLGQSRRILCGAGAVGVQFCIAVEELLKLDFVRLARL